MSKITTLKIGGPAKFYTTVKSKSEILEAISFAKAKKIPFLIIGCGSNLLCSDKGFDGVIIKNEIAGITTGPRMTVKVQSGTLLQDLVDFTIAHGLSGMQCLTGIPGTIGGAIFGNAGAYGQTISDHITKVICLDEEKTIKLSKSQCNFLYRDSTFKKNKFTILEVRFQLTRGDPKILKQEADAVLKKRLKKYPKDIKCPGSFFKNIVADSLPKNILSKIPKEKITFGKISAGYLLEAVGANGQRLHGIEIANYHGNLFINKGHGSARDFFQLAKKYALAVKQKFGITLEPEVQLIRLPHIFQNHS